MRYSVRPTSGARFLGHVGLGTEERVSKFAGFVSEVPNPKFAVSILRPNRLQGEGGGWERGVPREWCPPQAAPPCFDHGESIPGLGWGIRGVVVGVERGWEGVVPCGQVFWSALLWGGVGRVWGRWLGLGRGVWSHGVWLGVVARWVGLVAS